MAILDLYFSECVCAPIHAVFEKIADVASYPSFLPYCQKAEVSAIDERHFYARLWLEKGWVKVSFESDVTLDPYQSICMSAHSKTFKNLNGRWKLVQKNDAETQIDFSASIDFFSHWQKHLLMPVASSIAKELVFAFVRRFNLPVLSQE